LALTPMMRQYLDTKEQYKDAILFYRLGDFYEMFFEDALLASRVLEITLTGKDCGLEERAPMCGIPYHAAEGYVQRLIEKGYKVAICEQMESARAGKLVQRDVVRVITPGTVVDASMLADNENSYILSLYAEKDIFAAAYADVSTGAFYVELLKNENEVANFLLRIMPKEIIYPKENKQIETIVARTNDRAYVTPCESWPFLLRNAKKTILTHFKLQSVTTFGIEEDSPLLSAAGGLLTYLLETQKNALSHMHFLKVANTNDYMALDPFTHKNLELTENMQSKRRQGSLLWLLDKTKTAMGGRLLRQYIEQPLLVKKEIDARLDAVEEIKNALSLRSALREALDAVYDIERLLSKIAYGTLNARDMLAIKKSVGAFPKIKHLLKDARAGMLKETAAGIHELEDLYLFLEESIAEDPPLGVRDGNILKDGFNKEVDKLRDAKMSGNTWLSSLEEKEKEATGIKNLRIRYNKVFGYYIEVTKSNLHLVPYRYTRRQTLAGSERYVTPELKELEEMLLSAEEKCNTLEYNLFLQIREKLSSFVGALQENAAAIAKIDVLQSFAQAAYDYGYIKPSIHTNGTIKIENGRHPVVERAVQQEFVPNDVYMDAATDKLLIITGPNMAGKSTFMRQTGLIVLMAQMGSFVPASSAAIGIVDRIFTRVGASDDLASGQSTFMVEMNELASILHNATKNSLLILDEIGRGTSTLDGLSIAWATIEYILGEKGIGAKTLFATHYHELIGLEAVLPGLKNYSVSVREFNKDIIFLHKIKPGGTDKSFGIEVAKLAGLPNDLILRARAILSSLEQAENKTLPSLETLEIAPMEEVKKEVDMEAIIATLKTVDINALTPLEALSILNELKQRI
jgi:DNA mismatch repair protein MutS